MPTEIPRDADSRQSKAVNPPLRRTVTLWPVIGALYLMVAGGPYGLEELVEMTGYHAAIVILFLTAALWAVPLAMMVAEMSTAIPEDGGYYTWVDRAMGPFWGYQEAWLSLMASFFDMAAYPALFLLYLGRVWPSLGSGWRGTLIGLGVIGVCAVWNLLNAKAVARSSLVLTLALLAPFAVLVVAALRHHAAADAPAPAKEHLDWLGGILVAMWNSMSWDGASTFAGEVKDPQRTFPRVMLGTISLVMLSYVVPVAAVAHTEIPHTAWTTGSWVDFGRTLAGPALAGAMMLGGMLGSFGMFNSLVLSYSRVPMAMAEDGFLPKIFARRSAKTGAPWVAVLALSVCWAICMNFGFVRLVLIDVLLTGLSLLLEFAALIALRKREPQLARPFRIPGGTATAILLAAPPAALMIAAAVRNHDEMAGPISSLTLGLILIVAGILVYFISRRVRQVR